jgi:hypothetical protein
MIGCTCQHVIWIFPDLSGEWSLGRNIDPGSGTTLAGGKGRYLEHHISLAAVM